MRKQLSALVLCTVLLIADSLLTAPTPTPTPTPVLAPTLASTPVPPLAAHEWSQSEPLIIYGDGGGGLRPVFSEAYPMKFTLLPSGDLYLGRWNENLRADEILTTALSRQATCNLLNSIDQAGFFDYDPFSYLKGYSGPMPGGTDGASTRISVHAWRANSANLYNLGSYLRDVTGNPADCYTCTQPGFPTILPAIRNTYRLLNQYQPPGTLHALKPERLGVWLSGPPGSASNNDLIEWPLKSYPLAAVAPTKSYPPEQLVMILTGANATQVYDALRPSLSVFFGTFVREGDNAYLVFVRPLLPNEFNSSPPPQVSLSCSPSDGWIHPP